MKVVVGGLYHESNTFNPFTTKKEDFVLVEGSEMLKRVASTEVFEKAGFEVIPSIHAFGLSSGKVEKDAYRFFADKLLNVLKTEKEIDGIWLHLHGSMTVEELGSGEVQLIKEIREVVGDEIPISLALDPHGNVTLELAEQVNIIRSYRTVPHTDQSETEEITAQLLVDVLKNKENVQPSYERVPMIIGGEMALGNVEPMTSIFAKLEETEKIEGISTASFFIGFAWADTSVSSASVVVVPESEEFSELAKSKTKEIAEFVYSRRNEFKFDALVISMDEALQTAIESVESPVFISDSGDNTTGGAVGINTVFLKKVLDHDFKGKKVCLTAIFDEEAFDELNAKEIGEEVVVDVGINYDEMSKSVSVKGTLKAKGDLLESLGAASDIVGHVCTVSVGDVDVVVANSGESFTTIGHFEAAGLNIKDYDIISVKQGYLFPELSAISKLDILALTPGATYQLLEELEFTNIPRPCFPLDK